MASDRKSKWIEKGFTKEEVDQLNLLATMWEINGYSDKADELAEMGLKSVSTIGESDTETAAVFALSKAMSEYEFNNN